MIQAFKDLVGDEKKESIAELFGWLAALLSAIVYPIILGLAMGTL